MRIKKLEERVSKIEELLSDFPDLIGIIEQIEVLILSMPYIKEASDKLREELKKKK